MTITCTDYRPYPKNTLQAFVALTISDLGLTIRDVCLHVKDGERWVSMPARPYTDADGNRQWANIFDFTDATSKAAFKQLALDAIDRRPRSSEDAADPYP